MDWYYIIVLIIATILLLISLIIVGIALTKKGMSNTFPEYQTVCPDFWDVSGSICKPNVLGVNTPAPQKFAGNPSSVERAGVTIEKKTIKSIDLTPANWSGLCEKASWAKTNGIFWDGVANNNTCA